MTSFLLESTRVLERMMRQDEFLESVFRGHSTAESAIVDARAALQDRVEGFLLSTVECHPFDVIESLRRIEFPRSLEGHRETEDEGLGSVVELAALLLRRPKRTHSASADFVDDVPAIAPTLSKSLHEMLHLIIAIDGLSAATASSDGSSLAVASFARRLLLRGNQHPHIEREHVRRLLMSTESSAASRSLLGITAKECLSVIDAAEELVASRLASAAAEMDTFMASGEGLSEAGPESRVGYLMRGLTAETGRLVSFSARDLETLTQLSSETIEKSLAVVSIDIGGRDSEDVISSVLAGAIPMRGKGFARLNDRFVIVNSVAATDGLRQTFEAAFRSDADKWSSYSRRRGRIVESLAIESLERILDSPAALKSFGYFFNPRKASDGLPEAAGPPLANGSNIAEADGLFVFETSAIVVEVKSGGMNDRYGSARAGRLVNELKKIVGEATGQASRLESLARENHGLWLQSGEWLPMTHIVDVHKIVVSLDELGRSAMDIDELVRLGVIPDTVLPWVVSLHDLAVIAEIRERPPSFLLYLQRRTSPTTARLFKAEDELDLYMLFLRGLLRTLENPDDVAIRSPVTSQSTKKDIDRFEQQPIVFVGSQTDELVAWIDFAHGRRSTPIARPQLQANPRILKIVDFLVEGHKPGWLEAGADLLKGTRHQQRALSDGLRQLLRSARTKTETRSLTYGVGDLWGYSLCLAIVAADDELPSEAIYRLETFILLKKYQTRSPRALGLVFTTNGDLVHVHYEAGEWEFVEGAEEAIKAVRLRAPNAGNAPPSARRPTRRLRK